MSIVKKRIIIAAILIIAFAVPVIDSVVNNYKTNKEAEALYITAETHIWESNLISNGASIVDVQHWLGHSQPSTTLNFYAHTDSNAKIRTGEMIEKSLTF